MNPTQIQYMKGSIQTVNVIQYNKGSIWNVLSFPDTDEGNNEAEAAFTYLAKQNKFRDEDIEIGLEDGYCEQGEYQIFIVHSE